MLDILKPIWTTKRETARRVKRRISAAMKWAIAKGYRADDPAGEAMRENTPKTDAVDAAILARMGAALELRPTKPPGGALRDLGDLTVAREALVRDRVAALNRQKGLRVALLRRQCRRRLERNGRQLKAVDAEIARTLAGDEGLARRAETLASIPGVGKATAAGLLAAMPELGASRRRADSGSSGGGRGSRPAANPRRLGGRPTATRPRRPASSPGLTLRIPERRPTSIGGCMHSAKINTCNTDTRRPACGRSFRPCPIRSAAPSPGTHGDAKRHNIGSSA